MDGDQAKLGSAQKRPDSIEQLYAVWFDVTGQFWTISNQVIVSAES